MKLSWSWRWRRKTKDIGEKDEGGGTGGVDEERIEIE